MQTPRLVGENKGTQETATLAGKYLTFALGQEQFGIGILKIKEIIGVSEVATIKKEEIETTPNLGIQGIKAHLNFIQGMAKLANGVKILLDIDRVLAEDHLSALKEMF